MRVRLGLHVNGHGHEDMVRRYVDAVRPPFMKFLADASDPGQMDYCRARGAKVIYRVVLGDEGISEAGIKHILDRAAESAGHWDYLEFANEEEQGRDDAGQWDGLCRMMQGAMEECEKRGWRACILNTSVGQPELEATGKPRWRRPESVAMLQMAAAGHHIVGAHEYYRPRPWHGVEGLPGQSDRTAWAMYGKARGWWMLRVVRTIEEWRRLGIPLPKIVITESGRDAPAGTPGDGTGWRHEPVTPDGDYADFMGQYCRHLAMFPEVVGVVDFGFCGSAKWERFDLSSNDAGQFDRMITVMSALPDRPGTIPTPQPQPPTPQPEPQPMDALSAIMRRKLGNRFSDDRAIMPKHASAKYSTLSPAAYKGIAVHHSASARGTAPASIADYHVTHNGWAGIGYHIVIRQGVAHYVGDIATQRAHVAGRNHELSGICVTGDYTKEAPRTEDLDTLRLVVESLDELLGKRLPINGHGGWALAGHKTECPGALVGPARETRGGGEQTDIVDYSKVVWAIEEATRILEREGRSIDAGYIKSVVIPPIIKRRDGGQ